MVNILLFVIYVICHTPECFNMQILSCLALRQENIPYSLKQFLIIPCKPQHDKSDLRNSSFIVLMKKLLCWCNRELMYATTVNCHRPTFCKCY